MIEKAINKILSTSASLSQVNVSFGVDPQIPNATANPLVKDYIVFYRNTTIPYDTKTGNASGTIDLKSGLSTLDEAQIQVNLFSLTALGVANLAEKVRGVLDRTSGLYSTVQVQSIQFQNQVSLFEFNDTYNTKGLYQMTQFYQCRVEPQYQ
tara:strand:- start:1136 stop:1591 length:456 start_codon:yes stop_codon:yes gene_type:complete